MQLLSSFSEIVRKVSQIRTWSPGLPPAVEWISKRGCHDFDKNDVRENVLCPNDPAMYSIGSHIQKSLVRSSIEASKM